MKSKVLLQHIKRFEGRSNRLLCAVCACLSDCMAIIRVMALFVQVRLWRKRLGVSGCIIQV